MNIESVNPGTPAERKAVEERFETELFEYGITNIQRVAMRFGKDALVLTVYCAPEDEIDIFAKLPATFEGYLVRTITTGPIKAQEDETFYS